MAKLLPMLLKLLLNRSGYYDAGEPCKAATRIDAAAANHALLSGATLIANALPSIRQS
jgi:hypothetical protein